MNHAPAPDNWTRTLNAEVQDMRLWLSSPTNIDDTVESLADMLAEKHHDYGESNLQTFGEYGILVRASDKVARLKNLVEKPGEVKDETREDTWRDLAGYAIQALILMKKSKKTNDADIFEIRRNRLIRGICPDCGQGVVLRQREIDLAHVHYYCSLDCGFKEDASIFDVTDDLSGLILKLAARPARKAQK